MSVAICMATYNRPELLGPTLIRLLLQRPPVDFVYIVDDCSTDPQTRLLLNHFQREWGPTCQVIFKQKNAGTAVLFSDALEHLFGWERFDHVICMDSDVLLSPSTWTARMVEFLVKHPEVGYAAPEKPGSYLRLHRNGYDEVEWAVSICYAVPRAAWEAACDTAESPEGEWFDRSLGNAWDPDICYRLRRLGYRVAVVPDVVVQDLGEGKSTIKQTLARDNHGFNHKWNKRLLGRYIYKSPLMLRWDQYPLNVQFRLMVNAQQDAMRVEPTEERLSNHESERISLLLCKGNHPRPDVLRQLVDMDLSIRRDQPVEELDEDLLRGSRQFDAPRDAAKFSLRSPQPHA